MAHFARLDQNNVVIQVDVVHNDVLKPGGNEEEALGVAFLKTLYGDDTRWLQTSYNGKLRKNYAAIGGVYDDARDAFIPRQPFESWVLNEETCQWDAPVPYPVTDIPQIWDEQITQWVPAHG